MDLLSVYFGLLSVGIAVALFLGMLLCFEAGRRIGLRRTKKLGDAARAGIGGVDSAIYALLALLLGFAFSGANSRFDHRHELIAREVNTMSTAWLRIASLPAERQPEIRADLKRYVDGVIAIYRAPAGSTEETQLRGATARQEKTLWERSVAACLAPEGEKARMLLLPALNEMFDVVDEERLARRMHPPLIIFVMLAMSAFAAALFGGYSMSNSPVRNWFVIVSVSATVAITTWVVLEIEAPRLGVVRVDHFDRALDEVRAGMR